MGTVRPMPTTSCHHQDPHQKTVCSQYCRWIFIIIFLPSIITKWSRDTEKGKSWYVYPSKTQIRLCICAAWSVFDVCSMGSSGSNISSGGKLRLWSDCVDAQTDLNVCWRHMSTYTLCWIVDTGSIIDSWGQLHQEGWDRTEWPYQCFLQRLQTDRQTAITQLCK